MNRKHWIAAAACAVLFCLAGTQESRAQKASLEPGVSILDFGPETGFPQGAVENNKGQKVIGTPSNTTKGTGNGQADVINQTVYKKLVVQTDDQTTADWATAYQACKNKSGGDWRLPTQRELMCIWIFRTVFYSTVPTGTYYCATEASATYAYALSFSNGSLKWTDKNTPLPVRCVREMP